MRLLCADLHLDDNPANDYRWNIFNQIEVTCAETGCREVWVLGDLSDRRDRHSSILVNRLVEVLTKLNTLGIHWHIYPGNHDMPLEGPAYWTFLGNVSGVTFYDKPTLVGKALVLPHAPNPDEAWADLPKYNAPLDAILLHQCITGAKVSGREMKGSSIPDFFQDAKHVWAGDIHDPQKVGCVHYVGSPHPVAFGDRYKCRMILVRDNWSFAREVILDPPKKEVITIRSFSDLQGVKLKAGDKVRIRVELDASKADEWPELERRIGKWAERKGAELASTEALLVSVEGDQKDVENWADPRKVLDSYMTEQGLKDPLTDIGREVLDQAVKEEEKSGRLYAKQSGILTLDIPSTTLNNFCSFTEAQTVQLPQTPGLRLMTGVNEVDPELGANGAGKTSFWEAIPFALFGKSSDDMKGSDLTNDTQKRGSVVLSLRPGNSLFSVSRKSNPNDLQVNDQRASQETIQSLIRLTESQFFEVVLFGQGRRQFYDMGIKERDEFMNEVLQLDLWLKASDVTSAKIKSLANQVTNLEMELSTVKGGLGEVDQAHEDELREKSAKYRDEVKGRLEKAKQVIDDQRLIVSNLEACRDVEILNVDKARKALGKRPNSDVVAPLIGEIRLIDRDINRLRTEVTFYHDETVCSTCHQEITEKFRKTKIKQLEAEISDLEKQSAQKTSALENVRQQVAKAEEQWSKQDQAVRSAQTALAVAMGKVEAANEKLQLYLRAEKEIREQRNPYSSMILQLRQRRTELQQKQTDLEAQIDAIKGRSTLYQYWVQGFRKVRLFLAGRLLGALSLETKTALGMLGMPNWDIQFLQEKENKSGTTRSGVYITVADGESKRNRRSGGETQRIRLAVSLGISGLIQRMNGVSSKLEVWDEPGTFLSSQGMDNLFDVLSYRAETLGKSIWVIEHRALEHSAIQERWVVRKTKDRGSIVERLSGET